MTWRVAFSQGMRLPLCQILEVAWIGIGVEMLLQSGQARIPIRVSWTGAACHGRVCVGKPEGLPNWHSSDEDLSLHSSEQKSLAGDPGLLGTPVSSRAWAGAT